MNRKSFSLLLAFALLLQMFFITGVSHANTLLPAPGYVSASNVTSTTMPLSWGSVSGADLYAIRINCTDVSLSQTTSYTVTGLTPNQQGWQTWSAPQVIKTTLTAPQGLYISQATSTSTSLDWTSLPGADMYLIKINGQYSSFSSVDSQITVTGLTPNTPYTLSVHALQPGGGYVGDGASVSLTTPLVAPTGLQVTETTDQTVTVSWDALPNATLYFLKVNGEYKASSETTSQTITGLSPETQYSIQVAGSTSAPTGYVGDFSAAVNATTKAPAPTGPVTPANLTTTANENSITLNWAPAAGATAYTVSLNDTTVNTTADTSYTFTGLNADTLYTLGVASVNAGGTSTLATLKATTTKIVMPKLFLDTPVDVSLAVGASQSYIFTPSTTGMHRFYTGPYQGYGGANDTVLELYSDSAMTSLIASNDDYNGTFSRVTPTLTAGKTYYIKVVGYNNGSVHARLAVTCKN